MSRFSFIPRRLGQIVKTAMGLSATGATGFYLWTRKCYFEPFGPELNEPLFSHPMLKQLNPWKNPLSFDSCVREVPFDKLDHGLLEDARKGGTELIERFARGMWGGYGYAIQRRILESFKDEKSKDDVWSREGLLKCKYEPGTFLTNYLAVLEKSPACLTMRGCFGPHQDPLIPQAVENLFELRAELDEERKAVKLKLRCIAFDGTGGAKKDPGPSKAVSGFLHRSYSSLLVESGAGNCLR